MSVKIEARLPRGMRDMLPAKMIRRQYVIGVISNVFEEYGYEPVQTPVMEMAETLMGKYGPDAEKLIYTAQHAGGREQLALRYDLTVPLCRMMAMNPDLQRPFKRYHIAPVWRAERPQRGRYREFFQCDCDVVGTSSLLADAEAMLLICAVLKRLGFENFRISFNSRKILNGIGQYCGVPEDRLGGLYRSIDKLDKIGLDGVKQELSENRIPAESVDRLMDLLQTEGRNRQVLANLRPVLGGNSQASEGISDLERIIDCLEAAGVPERFYSLQFSMVRGLDYYTGSIYETTISQPKMPSITGGGRYDRLIGMFSKQSIPAVGTSFGIERIIDAMEELSMFPDSVGHSVVQVLVTLFGDEYLPDSLEIAQDLRRQGIRTELQFEAAKLKKQFSYANRKGIPVVVVSGPDEAAQGNATIKNFVSGDQLTLPRREIAGQIKAWLG